MNTATADMSFEDRRRGPSVEEQFDDPVQQRNAATLGMWIFLATEVLFFGVLFTSYTIMRVLYPAGFVAGSHETDLLLGSVETAVLLTSSIVVVLGLRAIKLGQHRLASLFLFATAALGAGFLVIHGFEYHAEYTEHLIPGINFHQPGPHARTMELFYCLYYFITGFHSLHLLIAVSVMLVLAVRAARGAFGPLRTNTLEVAVLYWHFVDIVWLFVFPLLYLIGRAHG